MARLYTSGEFERQLREEFEGNFSLKFHLAPPVFARRDPQTGKPLKRQFGGWIMPLFRLLAKLRFLRGGPLDPFTYSAERRMERQLIADYRSLIDQLLEGLCWDNYQVAVELASMPEHMRGFGHVKARNIELTKQREQTLLARFRSDPVRIIDPGNRTADEVRSLAGE